MTPEEIAMRLTLGTGGENKCSRALMTLDLWGHYNCPAPNDNNWSIFVNDARKNIYGLKEREL